MLTRHRYRLAKGIPVTTAVETEPEAATEVAPTKPPKLNSAAFKAVPENGRMRDAVRAAVEAFCKTLDKSKPLTKESTREMAERNPQVARARRAVSRLHDGDAHQRVLARAGRGHSRSTAG